MSQRMRRMEPEPERKREPRKFNADRFVNGILKGYRRHNDPEVVLASIEAHPEHGRTLAQALVRNGLRHSDARVKKVSIEALGLLGPVAAHARDSLEKHAKDHPDPEIRGAASMALEKVKPTPRRAITEEQRRELHEVVRAFSGEDEMGKYYAALKMSGRMEHLVGAIPSLVKHMLQSRHRGFRIQAADVLGSMGPMAHSALPALLKSGARHPDAGIRHHAIEAMGKMGKPAVPYLAQLLRGKLLDQEHRTKVLDALREANTPLARQLLKIQQAKAALIKKERKGR